MLLKKSDARQSKRRRPPVSLAAMVRRTEAGYRVEVMRHRGRGVGQVRGDARRRGHRDQAALEVRPTRVSRAHRGAGRDWPLPILSGAGEPSEIHEVFMATLGPPSAERTDVVTYPTMNRASGTHEGTDTSKATLTKTSDGKTSDAVRTLTEFLPWGKTLDTGASNVSRRTGPGCTSQKVAVILDTVASNVLSPFHAQT